MSNPALFDGGNLKVITNFLAGFLPPETGAEFLGYLGKATLETLAIATAGLALAFLLAVPLAYLASGAGREAPTLNPVTRALLTILRGIPELVWALIFVRVFGLGPAAGVLALGLTYGGMLAKVYAEILESVDAAPANACATTAPAARWPSSTACCRRPRRNWPPTPSTAGNAPSAPRWSWVSSAPAASAS
jgi:phosphonate transport system permease protein